MMRAVHKVGLISTGDDDVRDRRQDRAPRTPLCSVRSRTIARTKARRQGGEFTAFIPWTFQRENTALGRKITEEPTGIDYLQMLAVSRLFLDNIQHIQASWLTQGLNSGRPHSVSVPTTWARS